MKVYQFKYQEIFVNDTAINEEKFVEQYNQFFETLLRFKNISKMKIYQSINLNSYTISSKSFTIEPLLKKSTLPPFQFLACLN